MPCCLGPCRFRMFGCHLQRKNKGPSNLANYKEELAIKLKQHVSFEQCANGAPRQVSLGPKAAADGLTVLGFTAWDKVITATSLRGHDTPWLLL